MKKENTNNLNVENIEKSAKAEQWQYPVNYIGITNGPHFGQSIDFGWNSSVGGPNNEPVYACFSGTVIVKEYQSVGGNVVYIEHSNGIKAEYLHLSSSSVNVGDHVTQGQQIGIMGSTGTGASAIHLHFGLYSANQSISTKTPNLNIFPYLYVHSNQTVAAGTLNTCNFLINYASPNNIKYVYNIDDQGLNIRKTAGGTITGSLLQTATKVNVLTTSGSWSKIGNEQWVYSSYLSSTCPTYYYVNDAGGLNVRNTPSASGTLLNFMPENYRVQIYSESGTWAKISPTESRWCSKNYLTRGN